MKSEILEKLKSLPDKSGNTVAGFADDIANLFGDELYSMILFGSAAGRDFIEGKSDINTMIILESVRVSDLEMIMEAGERYRRKGLAVPLVFERGHVISSLDTFPIEFSDMKQRHILLYGIDPLENTIIEKKNLRYQCERELKSILVNLRRGFLRTGGKRENLEALLEESLSSVLAACRGMLWMSDKTPPDGATDILAEVHSLHDTDTAAIDRVWRLHQGESGATALLEALFDDYIRNIADLAGVVDRL